MNAIVNKMLNAYGQVQVDTSVETASPHKLIALLFEGALTAIAQAKRHLEHGDIAARGAAISKAISIIQEGLRASISLESGGEVAQNLDALYEYMTYRLLQANLGADPAALAEVDRLMREIKTAWDEIGLPKVTQAAVAPAEPPTKAASYGKA